MSINYNNIDDLINLLYEFVYLKDKNTLNKYYFEKLEPSKIDIYDLVKKDFDYKIIFNKSFKNKDNFKIMAEIDNTVFNHRHKRIILKKYFKNFPVTLMIQKYPNNDVTETIQDLKYELFMNQIVSKFIISENIPFFLLNICNFDVRIEDLKPYEDYYNIVNKEFYGKKISNNNNEDLYCVSLYEHYQSYIPMEDLFKQDLSKQDITDIIFQVIYVYALLFSNFSNFKHGCFDIKSFLVVKESVPRTINLKFMEKMFKIQNCNYTCKLFNYRFSTISSLVNNSVTYVNLVDPSYEIYYFFKTLHDFCREHNSHNFDIVSVIITNLIESDISIFNKKLMDSTSFYDLHYVSIIPSQILLKNNFFTSFINMEYKDILKNENFESEFIGYRDLTSSNVKILTGGARRKSTRTKVKAVEEPVKKTKRRSKKGSKKGSKKSSKKSSKRLAKLRRSLDEDEDVSDEDDNFTETLNSEIEENERSKKYEDDVDTEGEDDDEDEDNEKVDEEDSDSDEDNNLLTVEEEEQNNFVSEGDDDKSKTPFTSNGGSIDYKKMYEKMLSENKKLKSKSGNSKSKAKSKSSSKKQSKSALSDSSSIDFNDTEQGAQNIQNLQGNHQAPNGMQPPQAQQMSNMVTGPDGQQAPTNAIGSALGGIGSQGPQGMQGMQFNKQTMAGAPSGAANSLSKMEGMPSFSDAPKASSTDALKESGVEPMFPQSNLKMGSNTDMNSVINQLDENSLIPVIPEMQNYFSDASFMQGQGAMGDMGAMGAMPPMPAGKPQIMDQGIMGQNGMGGPGGLGALGALGASGGLPTYDPEIAKMAGMQGMAGMMGGGLKNNAYLDEINNLIINEFNTKLSSIGVSSNIQSGGNPSKKKKKIFFLQKIQ